MKNIVSSILLLLMALNCRENTASRNQLNEIKIVKFQPLEDIAVYIEHPQTSDKICLKDIARAKKDIEIGDLVFTMPYGEGNYNLRSEKYIRELCKRYHLAFRFEMVSDVINKEGRKGCYEAFMDKKIDQKYGLKFRQFILEEADLMLIKSNDTVLAWDCDKKPQIEGISSAIINVQLEKNLRSDLSQDKINYVAGLDVAFYIDKQGIASGYHLEDYNSIEKEGNEKYKARLFRAGIDALKKHKNCVAGEILGQKVITKQIIRIYFDA